jgi:hypothetical protein
MSGAFRTWCSIRWLLPLGLLPNGEGGLKLNQSLAQLDPSDLFFVSERGSYAPPPDSGVLPSDLLVLLYKNILLLSPFTAITAY